MQAKRSRRTAWSVRRSFPGLWRDVAAFWAEDDAKMLAALNAGLATEEHQKFVERLAAAAQ